MKEGGRDEDRKGVERKEGERKEGNVRRIDNRGEEMSEQRREEVGTVTRTEGG